MPELDPTVLDVLETVRSRFTDVPFLALGQTVFWDEPTKAVWRRILDRTLPDAQMVAGVHDTDYFAKTTAHVFTTERYAILPHDDGLTHDLWSAAGEMSALLGSESVPRRQMFLHQGVPFDWLARTAEGGRFALTAALTTAWGWSAIVRTDSHNVVAADVPVDEIAKSLLGQLDWAFELSLSCIADEPSRINAREVASQVRRWTSDFLENCQHNCRLGDLYRTILPRFYEMLLGAPATNFRTTASSELFQFNRQTCHRPLFHVVDAFLNPKTRSVARSAYDKAVTGSGIYTLSGFGPGAVPFDVVVPSLGRGTLRLTASGVAADIGGRQWRARANGPITTRAGLAELLEGEFGPSACLVGKAVVLPDMISAEHINWINESGSGYTPLTRRMNDALVAAGFPLEVYPVVRLTFNTWDSLAASETPVVLQLPEHLASAFGTREIAIRDFSKQWRTVIGTQLALQTESRAIRSIRGLLTFLEHHESEPPRPDTEVPESGRNLGAAYPAEPGHWTLALREYDAASHLLAETAKHSAILADRITEHRSEVAVWTEERQDLERRKGIDWRSSVLPLVRELASLPEDHPRQPELQRAIERQAAIRAKAFDEPIAEARDRIRSTQFMIHEFRRQRRLMERSPECLAARKTIAAIVRKAQMARAILVRNAFQTIDSLEHTHLRPTSWWIPMLDSKGTWFDAIVAGTKARFEWLAEDGPR